MNDILLVQRTFTYHGNLIACEIANHASRYDVLSRVTRLIWSQSRITHADFGAITRHAKTLCRPLYGLAGRTKQKRDYN